MKFNVSCSRKLLKGEDATLILCKGDQLICVVADGHGGNEAASIVTNDITELIEKFDVSRFDSYYSIFAELHKRVLQTSTTSGCTLSVVIWNSQTGKLFCANCGDSDVILFEPSTYSVLSESHRLRTNASERLQLIRKGCVVSQARNKNHEFFGPHRMWPGGLSMSRAIGDADCVYCSHIPFVYECDVLNGVIVLASDGVWDNIPIRKIEEIVKKYPSCEAAKILCKKGSLTDDKSAIVLQVSDMIVNARNPIFSISRNSSSSSLSSEDDDEQIINLPVKL